MASKLEIAERRRKLQELEGSGVTSTAELARKLGVTPQCIRKDLTALNLAWAESEKGAEFRQQIKRRLIARKERRYVELEAEWQRSKENKEREKSKVRESDAGGEGGKSQTTEAEKVTEGRLGDPAIQRLMLENDRFEADLVGVIVTKTALTNIDGTEEAPLVFTEADKARLIAALAAELGVKDAHEDSEG